MFRPPAGQVEEQRWLPGRNDAGEDAPACALVRVTGYEDGRYTFARPDADGQAVWVAGPLPTFDGEVGAVTADLPAWAYYDSGDGTPAVGELWGAAAGSWKLAKGKAGFRVVGDPDTDAELVPVERAGAGGAGTGCGWLAGLRVTECLRLTRVSASGACDCGDAAPDFPLGYDDACSCWTTAADAVAVCGVDWVPTFALTTAGPQMQLAHASDTRLGVLDGCNPGEVTFAFGGDVLCTGLLADCDNVLRLKLTCEPVTSWWCVDPGDGSRQCVPSCVEPSGSVSGPYDTTADCEAACGDPWWCTSTSDCGTAVDRHCVQQASAPTPDCGGPFETETECTAGCECPIPGWGGAGWYCVWDTGTSACVPVELVSGDSCDYAIEICSGPYPDEATATASCECAPIVAMYTVSVTGVAGGVDLMSNPTEAAGFNRLWRLDGAGSGDWREGPVAGAFDYNGQTTGNAQLSCNTLTFLIGADSVAVYTGTTDPTGDAVFAFVDNGTAGATVSHGWPATLTVSGSLP